MSMGGTLERPRPMARKKASDRKTTMVRAYEDFISVVNQAASERQLSVADFMDQFLRPCVEKAHRDYISDEAKRLAKGGE